MNVQRLMAVCTLLLLLLTPGHVAGQTPVPAGDTDPIDFVFTSYPRQIVYLGVDPGASVFVTLLAYDTVIPAGLTPDYSCDVDGDGAFTPWFFRDDCGEKVTMAGPFVATMRVRAAGHEPACRGLAHAGPSVRGRLCGCGTTGPAHAGGGCGPAGHRLP